MFRIPSWREILALFRKPKTVDHAVAGIALAASQAQAVAAHNDTKGQEARDKAADLRVQAADHDDRAAGHEAEADRAARVATNLTALIA